MNRTTFEEQGRSDDHLLLMADCRRGNRSLLIEKFISSYPVDKWKSEGFFTNDDILDINCHWLGFNPVRPVIHFGLAIAYVAFFFVGWTFNALVIYIIGRLVYKLLYDSFRALIFLYIEK